MKTLWTPWRIEHVRGTAPKKAGCLFEPPGTLPFCRESLLLYRDLHLICLLNRFPYANGHLLVAPSRHVGCITELNADEHSILFRFVSSATDILKRVLNPDGFNIGMNIGSEAGAGIDDHIHVHIVPRWNGDHNFISVLADIRTIPEHIDATFDRLLPDFQSLIDK